MINWTTRFEKWLDYVRHRAEFRRVAPEFYGFAASITGRRRYRAAASSPTGCPSLELGARRPLERAGDIGRCPPATEISLFRRHALVIDKAAVERPRGKNHVIAQGSEGLVRIGIAPGHIAQRFVRKTTSKSIASHFHLQEERRRDGCMTNGTILAGGK
jgi:hypothetical protein